MGSFTDNKSLNYNRQRQLPVLERRKRLIKLVRKHPDWHQQEYADALGCNKSTVSRDLRTINNEFNITNQESWQVHRNRVLKEITERKNACLGKLGECKSPTQGSRWQEEWTKLMIQECKLLGINSPSMVMINKEVTIKKEEKDAAIDAVFSEIGESEIEMDDDGRLMLAATASMENENDKS